MKTKDFNLCKSEIRRLLKKIDSGFVPNRVYGKDSVLFHDAVTLRYVVVVLCSSLVDDYYE